MSEKNTGGSAFPHMEGWNSNEQKWEFATSAGMTLRDYFAAKAMQSKLLCEFPAKLPEGTKDMTVAQFIAKQSYQMADAMLKARES